MVPFQKNKPRGGWEKEGYMCKASFLGAKGRKER